MAMDYFDLGGVSQVRLLQDKDNVFKPFFLDEIQELPGGLRPGVYDRKDEENDVRARDKTLGNALMLGDHGVGSRRVDHVKIVQERDREVALRQLGRNLHGLLL